MSLWRKLQRWMDRRMLWPAIRNEAPDRLTAEGAFRLHMDLDPAYRDLDDFEQLQLVKNLP